MRVLVTQSAGYPILSNVRQSLDRKLDRMVQSVQSIEIRVPFSEPSFVRRCGLVSRVAVSDALEYEEHHWITDCLARFDHLIGFEAPEWSRICDERA